MNIVLSWSGGKDSALALHAIQASRCHKVVSLITTMTRDYDRVSIHGVSRRIIEAQSKNLGIPAHFVFIDADASNEDYEREFCSVLLPYKAKGVVGVAYGDIFLESLKQHREDMLATIGMQGIFPLWKQDTSMLARQFIQNGFKGLIACVDVEVMSGTYAGQEFDEQLITSLHSSIDPCGENGEFHSCVYDGPIFKRPLKLRAPSSITKGNFRFADILLHS